MAGRITAALVAALAAVAVAGCDSVPSTQPAEAGLAPGVEALAYLPAGADVVAVVDTDLEGKRWRSALKATRRAGLDGRLAEVVQRLAVTGIDTERARGLLGNVVAWAPREGVAALVVADRELLDELATIALRTGILRDAGTHADARLLEGDGMALAVSGATVVAARDAATVRRALDRRARGEGYGVERFKRAVAGLPVDALVRVALDGDALAARHARELRAVPFVAALGEAGLALRAGSAGALIDVRIEVAEGLLADDAPLPGGERPQAAAPRPFGGIHLGFADLPHLLRAGYRAAFAAAPAATANAELAAVEVRRRRRSDPARDLLAAMEGPATLQLDRDGVLARAQLRDGVRRRAARAAGLLAERLPRILAAAGIDGVKTSRIAGLHAAIRGSDVLAVYGVVEDVFVAADSRPQALLERARTDSADEDDPAAGPLTVNAGPRAIEDLLGIDHARSLRGWARLTRHGLSAQLALKLEPR